jgi:hypothetical protein
MPMGCGESDALSDRRDVHHAAPRWVKVGGCTETSKIRAGAAIDRRTSVTETMHRQEIRPVLTKGATAMNRILQSKAAQSA